MPPAACRPRTVGCVAVAAVCALLAGCGGGDERVVVLAASSLIDAFASIESAYEAGHPTVDVVISFGGSSALAAQIGQGAPADVFAAADLASMARVERDAVGTPTVFARNRLVIAVPAGNPEGISGLADLGRDDLVVVLAAPEVPAGNYAAIALALAGVAVEPASLEQNVRAVASKIALGEADAGIVYVTDVAARQDRLDAVAFAEADDVVAEYPIVALTDAGRSFAEFVAGADGRALLVGAGFEVP